MSMTRVSATVRILGSKGQRLMQPLAINNHPGAWFKLVRYNFFTVA